MADVQNQIMFWYPLLLPPGASAFQSALKAALQLERAPEWESASPFGQPGQVPGNGLNAGRNRQLGNESQERASQGNWMLVRRCSKKGEQRTCPEIQRKGVAGLCLKQNECCNGESNGIKDVPLMDGRQNRQQFPRPYSAHDRLRW